MDTGRAVYARYIPYLERYVRIRFSENGVARLSFPETIDEDIEGDHELLERVEAYLTGTVTDDFTDVTLDLPEGNRRVYEAVRGIPYGTDITVERLLGQLADEDAAADLDETALRERLMDNPIPLLIPDHRVRDGPSGAPPVVEQRLRSLEQPVG